MNESFALGKKIAEPKLVRKVFHSLPRRFDMKVTAIEEVNDIATLKLDQLFGALHTFELIVDDKGDNMGKGLAFHSMSDKELNQDKDRNVDENLADSIALLTKYFMKVARQFNKRSRETWVSITKIIAAIVVLTLSRILRADGGS